MRDNALRTAPFFTRAAAYLLDRLILGAVLLIPRTVSWAQSVGSDALSRAVLFRFTWADITPGKKAMGLTVVGQTGERPDFLTVLWRETWARYLSSLLCIGYILCAVEPEKGALHDRILDTRVVYAPPKERRAPAPVRRPVTPALPAGDADWYAPNR